MNTTTVPLKSPRNMASSQITAPLLLLVIVAYLASTGYRKLSRKRILARLPLLDGTGKDIIAVTHDGYVNYLKKGQAYRLRTDPAGVHDRVMLPFKYLDEVKNSPESGLSFLHFSDLVMLLKYSGGPPQSTASTHAVKNMLNRNLPGLVPQIHTGIATDVANMMPVKEKGEWASLQLYQTVVAIVARNAARVMADPRLSDNEEWIRLSISVTMQTFAAAQSIRQKYSPAMYWMAKYRDEPSKTTRQCRSRAAKILKPIYDECLKWLLSAPDREFPSVQNLADDLLFLAIASIHSTTATVCTIICDLVTRPEAYNSLREEVDAHYPEDATWSSARLAKLVKLDSFMKESQRFHTIGFNTMARAPRKNYTFGDGLVVPADTICQMASHELNMDPDNHANPEIFDANRFINYKETTGSNKYSFTSIASDYSVNFGAGLHTCPGRSLASTTMKIILAELISKYHLKIQDGQPEPKMIVSGLSHLTDPSTVLMIKLANA